MLPAPGGNSSIQTTFWDDVMGNAGFLNSPSLYDVYMDVSKNFGTPKSSILIGFGTIINHPFWGTTIFGNTHIGTSLMHHPKYS